MICRPTLSPEVLAELIALEESLWRTDTRFDAALRDATFADDFTEFGRSGRVYSRQEMLFSRATAVAIHATFPLPNFRARAISDDVVQVTYISEVRYGDTLERANRSSLWTHVQGRWRLCFHQGTPVT